ncbi:hypothetical protein F5B20DRAFT_559809 [Whalleya microplaca]|nr:hypothetical protein F5B20DRAFT_559809 [Whalleya microplaca]
MFPGTAAVELGGQRVLFHRSPRGRPGTPRGSSRVLAPRLCRPSHRRLIISSTAYRLSSLTNPRVVRHNISRARFPIRSVHSDVTPAVLTDPQLDLLQDLLHAYPSADGLPGAADVSKVTMSSGEKGPNFDVVAMQFPNPFRKALEAMQQRDTRLLLVHLDRLCKMDEHDLHDAMAKLPRTTFTEFLRSLDPLHVAEVCDPTDKAYVSVGMFKMLNLESSIDEWGVRKLYTKLLGQMLVLVKALKASGQVLYVDDYTYLLRCAGAASDPTGAKWIWQEMDRTRSQHWRHSQSYLEFLSARFLARFLYTGYDKSRRIVSPANLHLSRFTLGFRRVTKLHRLRINHRRRRLRFGLNKDVTDHAKELMRYMRTIGPTFRLLNTITRGGAQLDKELLCAVMISFGRVGALRFIGDQLIRKYFGIRISMSALSGIEDNLDEPRFMRVGVGSMIPDDLFMKTVVEIYGSNGEIGLAYELIDFVSKSYGIPIPLSVWQELLEWTEVHSAPPASTAWKMAGMFSKIPVNEAVEMLWNIMKSEPHNIVPGFDQYAMLIQSLLGRRDLPRALPLMREAIRFYEAHWQEFESAVFEYVQSERDGVRISEPLFRYKSAKFTLERMWYEIRRWCRMFLLKVRPLNFDPDISAFIEEFRLFIPNPTQYRTASGYVELHDPAWERAVIRPGRTTEVYLVVKRRHVHQDFRKVRWQAVTVSSRHSLAAIHGSPRLQEMSPDPMALLYGERTEKKGRATIRKTMTRYEPTTETVDNDSDYI